MDMLAETEGKICGAITIHGPDGFASPFPDTLFPCLIWATVISLTRSGPRSLELCSKADVDMRSAVGRAAKRGTMPSTPNSCSSISMIPRSSAKPCTS